VVDPVGDFMWVLPALEDLDHLVTRHHTSIATVGPFRKLRVDNRHRPQVAERVRVRLRVPNQGQPVAAPVEDRPTVDRDFLKPVRPLEPLGNHVGRLVRRLRPSLDVERERVRWGGDLLGLRLLG
jgi:hypothetical protein